MQSMKFSKIPATTIIPHTISKDFTKNQKKTTKFHEIITISLFIHDTYLSPLQLEFWHVGGHVEGMGIIQMHKL